MADGRGQAEIRTSHPPVDYGEVLSLVPETSNVLQKERVGLDDGS